MITQIKYSSRVKGLIMALVFSIVAHGVILLAIRIVPIVSLALGFSRIKYVKEAYDTSILINFSKHLKYPSGYLGFGSPQQGASLEEMEKEKERLRRQAEQRKRERELAEKREAEKRAEEEAKAKAEAEEKKQQDLASADQPQPALKQPDASGGFGRINTAPIHDQIERIYQANKDGRLSILNGKIKVGVAGSVNPDGTLKDYRVHIPSGVQEIDDSAMAILAAVSESRALGPLSKMSEITMVLNIDQTAQLVVTGITDNESDAINLVNLANVALALERYKKNDDLGSMLMLKNLTIKRTGNQIEATIIVPREMAKDAFTKSMDLDKMDKDKFDKDKSN